MRKIWKIFLKTLRRYFNGVSAKNDSEFLDFVDVQVEICCPACCSIILRDLICYFPDIGTGFLVTGPKISDIAP